MMKSHFKSLSSEWHNNIKGMLSDINSKQMDEWEQTSAACLEDESVFLTCLSLGLLETTITNAKYIGEGFWENT